MFVRSPSGGGYMRRRVKVRELMQREGLSGEVVSLSHSRRAGIIHGDDGYDVTFNDQSLALGLGYGDLVVGLRVSYGVFFGAGAKVPTAINVMPALGESKKIADQEKVRSVRAAEFGAM